jgi:hypothetical protein
MTDNKGALLFSKEHPQVTGYLVIDGEHYEIVGWKPSPTRAEITVRRIDHDGSRTGASECDPA